ncbi:hypothetical protein SDC9_197928 [bioreactor metagenome]|uniref:Uncharacterized protein n=1 Tax=bioreactor metagenome TaxID=1076179 RepID=A0A645IHI4_9ZZZZ
MKVFAVVNSGQVCFIEFHRFRIASFLVPEANLLNNVNPLANEAWTKLANDIDKLEVGQSLEFGKYVVMLEDVPDHIVQRDISGL